MKPISWLATKHCTTTMLLGCCFHNHGYAVNSTENYEEFFARLAIMEREFLVKEY